MAMSEGQYFPLSRGNDWSREVPPDWSAGSEWPWGNRESLFLVRSIVRMRRRSLNFSANTQRFTLRQSVDDREFRKVGGCIVGHSQHDQGAIVVRCSARAAVAIRCSQDSFGDIASRISLRNS